MKFQPDKEWDEHIERKQKQRTAGSKGDLLYQENKRRKEMIKNQKAQGDILFTPVDGKPEGAKLTKEKRTIALGEATGHHHSFTRDVDVYEVDGDPRKWICLEEESTIDHQEHGAITFAPGWYVVDYQVEADPFTGMSRRVAD